MSNFINKHFYKNKCILAIYLSEDRRVKFKYVIPNGKNLKIGNTAYILNEDDLFLYKGIPAYILTTKDAEPVKVNPLNQRQSFLSAEDYNTAISSAVAREIFLSTKKGFDSGVLSLILSIFTLIGIVVLAYFGSQLLGELTTKIDELREILGLLGGM